MSTAFWLFATFACWQSVLLVRFCPLAIHSAAGGATSFFVDDVQLIEPVECSRGDDVFVDGFEAAVPSKKSRALIGQDTSKQRLAN